MGGKLIGKGGATIREIRERTGATVHLSTEVSGAGERAITITGSDEQVPFNHLPTAYSSATYRSVTDPSAI